MRTSEAQDTTRILARALNAILRAGVVRFGPQSLVSMRMLAGEPVTSHRLVLGTVVFEAEGHRALYQSLQMIHKLNLEIFESFTFADIRKAVLDFLTPVFGTEKRFDQCDAAGFLNKLLAQEPVSFLITREVLGYALSERHVVLEVGPFTVFDFDTSFSQFVDVPQRKLELFPWGGSIGTAISVEVVARTRERAIERADVLFERCETLLRFLRGVRASGDVGIFNYRDEVWRRTIVAVDGKLDLLSSSNAGEGGSAYVDAASFTGGVGEALWQIMFEEREQFDVQARVIRAVEWYAGATMERSISSAFLKAAVALELLLIERKTSKNDVPISARLAGAVARLLGEDKNRRRWYEAEVRRLYKIRSEVAHSGITTVGYEDFLAIDRLVRDIIGRLCIAPFRGMRTLGEIGAFLGKDDYVKKQRQPSRNSSIRTGRRHR